MNILDSMLGFVMGLVSAGLAFAYFLRSNDMSYKTHIGYFVFLHNSLGALCAFITYQLLNNPEDLTIGRTTVILFALAYMWMTRTDNGPWYSVPKYMKSDLEQDHPIHQ